MSKSKTAEGKITLDFVVKGTDSSSLVPAKIVPTTASTVSKPKEKYTTLSSKDGKFINCGSCKGKGHTDGIVTTCHPFALGAWEDHYKAQKHTVAVANVKVEREREKKEGKPKKQSDMACFSEPLGKKKKQIKTA
eukprot:2305670-Ditylum_brightwellii.AAC.1